MRHFSGENADVAEVEKFQFERAPTIRPREVQARVSHTRWIAEGTLEISFEPTSEPMFPFVPGQYVSIVLPADPEQGLRRELRPYSMWNHPTEDDRVVTVVKMVDGGRCSALLAAMKVGDPLTFVGPLGNFTLRRPLHSSLYFVATGTGLVPLRAMVADLIQTGEIDQRDTWLFFGVRSQGDLFGVDELQRWAEEHPRFRFIPTLSRPKPGWDGATGRVTAHLSKLDFPVDDMQIYLCGNGAMVSEAIEMLESRGLPRRTRRIIHEKYFN